MPGHTVQLVAVRAGDVLYAADARAQKDPAARLGHLKWGNWRACGGWGVLPGHGGPVEDLAELVLNRAVVSAHLTELLETGQVSLQVEDNELRFAPLPQRA